jgi:hypothetical protein
MGSSTKGNFVVVRPTTDINVREYHLLGQSISDLPYAEFYHPLYESSKEDFGDLGPTGKEIVGEVMAEGNKKSIERITFRPNSVRIYKLPSSDWDSVETNIVFKALNNALNITLQPVMYGTSQFHQLLQTSAAQSRRTAVTA